MTVQEARRVQSAYADKAKFLINLYFGKYQIDVRAVTIALRDTLTDALMVECLESELSDCEQEQNTPLAATPL
jgi:hypothetical protein